MPAPLKNQNNKKPVGEAKTHWIKMRVRQQDKSRAVREAQDAGMNLSEYIAYKMGWV